MNRRERQELLQRLQHDAQLIAQKFQLHYRGILAEHPNVKSRYGVCYSDGLIKIRLNHATTGAPLKYSSMVDTLCHELAHLKHFNHGPHFKRFFWQLLSWARHQGIYQPGPIGKLRSKQRPGLVASDKLYSRLPQRNGVLVFPEMEVEKKFAGPDAPIEDEPEVLPWLRYLQEPGSTPTTTPKKQKLEAPRRTAEQLFFLFEDD